MSVKIEAYRVVVDQEPCEHCGAGKTWTVVGPDGYAGGESYLDEADAEHEAHSLNDAYNKGREETLYQISGAEK